MKTTLYLLLTLFSFALYGQKAASPVPAKTTEWVPYADTALNIIMEYPETWEVKQVPGRALTISSPQVQQKSYSTSSINLVVVSTDSLGKHITAKEVLKILETAYQQEFSNYTKVSDEFITINGYSGVRLLFKCELEHVKLEFMTWAFIYRKKTYVFTCKARANSFEKNKPLFDNMIQSFRIKGSMVYYPYVDSVYGVKVMRPADWKAVKDTASVLSFYSPEEPPNNFSEASMSLIISAAGNASLKELSAQMQEVCAKEYADYKKMKSESVNIGAYKGTRLVFTGSKQHVNLEVILYGFLLSGKAYLITCATHANYYEQYKPIFDTLLKSMEVAGVLRYRTYNDTTYKMSINYPTGWQVMSDAETPLTISSPRLPMQDYADASINMVVVQEDISMTELLPQLENAYKGQLKNYEKIKSEVATDRGNKCIKMYFRGERSNAKLHYYIYVLQATGKIFSFTCASREVSYDSYEPVFEKMMQSVKVE